MTDTLDGLSNIYSIQANIEALKNAQTNSSAALNSSNKSQSDPDSFLLQTQQNFNTMLNSLVSSSDDENKTNTSNSSSLFDSSQNSYLTSMQSTADLQRLAQMEQYSPLIGRTVTYFDSSSNAEKSGVISNLSFNSGSASLVLSDGSEIPAGSVTSLK